MAAPGLGPRACERFETASDEVLQGGVVRFDQERSRFVLTPAGKEVAVAWHLGSYPDDDHRWDAGFRPEPPERVLLPNDWDWDQRPPFPRTWAAGRARSCLASDPSSRREPFQESQRFAEHPLLVIFWRQELLARCQELLGLLGARGCCTLENAGFAGQKAPAVASA